MPPKHIASAGTTLFLSKKLIFQIKIYTHKLEYLVPFLEEIYMPPKPLAINHRVALSLFHR